MYFSILLTYIKDLLFTIQNVSSHPDFIVDFTFTWLLRICSHFLCVEKALWNEFYGRSDSNFFFLIFIKIKKCLIWLHWVLVAAYGILSCGRRTLGCSTWDLVPLTGSNLGPLPALGVWSLGHWTTRQVPLNFFLWKNQMPKLSLFFPLAVPWQLGLRNINQTQSLRYASLKVRHGRTEAWGHLGFMLVKLARLSSSINWFFGCNSFS